VTAGRRQRPPRMARRWHGPPVRPEAADRRLGWEDRPRGRSLLIGTTCSTMALPLIGSGHRIASVGGPGRSRAGVWGIQRLVNLLAVPAAFSVSFWTESPMAVAALSTV
jgi:hypothetical protein